MRNRNRSNLLVTDVFNSDSRFFQKWYNLSNGQLINQYWLPKSGHIITKKSDADSISDDPTKGDAVKEVIHSTEVRKFLDMSEDTYIEGNNKYVTSDNSGMNSAHWQVWGQYGFIYPNNILINWNVSDETLIRATKDAFYNECDVDTLLNVMEAPQIVTGLQSIYNSINTPVRVPKNKALEMIRKFRRPGTRIRKGASFISGGFLYYAFGIAPLISDLRKLSAATFTYSKRLKQASASAGTAVSVHRQCTGTFTNTLVGTRGTPLPAGYGASGDGTSVFHASVQPMLVPKKICTIRGVRNHKYFSPYFQELDFLAARFGSIGPASFAWERIPFSFVFDWFVDASDVFNRLDNALTGSRKMIKDACLSEKWQCNAGAVKHPVGTSDHSSFDGVQTASNELSYYHRKPISVNNITVARSGRFGKWQIAELAALLGQMTAKLKLSR